MSISIRRSRKNEIFPCLLLIFFGVVSVQAFASSKTTAAEPAAQHEVSNKAERTLVGGEWDEKASLQKLKKWVELSSGSGNPEGVLEVQNEWARELKELGFSVDMVNSKSPKLAPLLVAERKGLSEEWITFVVHADTVFEKSSGFTSFLLQGDGLRAQGPGVIDAKGGMIVILEGVSRFLRESSNPRHSLRVISNSGEEVGTPDFLPLFKKYSQDSKIVLGFEPCLDDGSIIKSRKGNRWYKIKVVGREAHAGRAHKNGVNACLAAAKIISEISKITDYKKDLTVSVGRMVGGQDKYNIVCGEAEFKVDVRFATLKDRDQSHSRILKALANSKVKAESDGEAVKTQYEIVDDTNPFSVEPESEKWINSYLRIVSRLEGRKIEAQKSGGAADTNHLSRKGLSILDGLGACGGKMHTTDEFLKVESLKSRSLALAEFLMLFESTKKQAN